MGRADFQGAGMRLIELAFEHLRARGETEFSRDLIPEQTLRRPKRD
jgi:hypothetical protein